MVGHGAMVRLKLSSIAILAPKPTAKQLGARNIFTYKHQYQPGIS